MDISDDSDAKMFLTLFESFGLENQVFTQIHKSGHALDLSITRKNCDFSILPPITNHHIKDHSLVKRAINHANPVLEVKNIVSEN